MKKIIKKIIVNLIYITLIALIGLGIYKNPQIIDNLKNFFTPAPVVQAVDFTPLQTQIDEIKIQLAQPIEIPNLANKADAEAVLSLASRLDRIEEKVNKLSQVSDSNALILTATMMVKDAIEQGGSFEIQAEVLNQIAESDIKIKNEVALISSHAILGVKTPVELIEQFDIIYNEMVVAQKEVFENTWKDKINTKLDEFVKVRKINKNAPEFKLDTDLEKIKNLVDDKKFELAIQELQRNPNQEWQINEKLNAWKDNVANRSAINNAIAKIVNHLLVAMKVNAIKKETAND